MPDIRREDEFIDEAKKKRRLKKNFRTIQIWKTTRNVFPNTKIFREKVLSI